MAATGTSGGVGGTHHQQQQQLLTFRQHHCRPTSSSFLTVGASLLFVFLLMSSTSIVRPVHAQAHQPKTNLSHGERNPICHSVDIRNTLDTFRSLEGCRVVEGFVQILLFDNVNETALNNLSFPLLTEITDFFLMYRVNGLRSIGRLFPNLSVIRGRNPFYNYAFVVFEMSSLQEIGLYSLTNISRGLIRIDKNPSLCFVNSINWDLIAQEKGDHYIRTMKPANECPICPAGEKIKGEEETTALTCPKAPHSLSITSNYGRTERLCWNRHHCQRICPTRCVSCNDLGECCNEQCLGGCANNNTNTCIACQKYASYLPDGKTVCQDTCLGRYDYDGRRCVSFEECRKLPRPINLHARKEIVENPYKIFNGSCILHCPPNYMNDFVNGTCIKCQGKCKKDCPGVNIDSIQIAKQLRGCTRITGSLEIQLRGGRNVVNELEENLSMIEEINGYLKVVRSYPLLSLSFLKRLRVIRGEQLDSDRYAFVVLDNQNLQNLWDWGDNRTLEIRKGRLFFHFNPKLCLNEIETLQKKTGLSNFTEFEVATNSNGDKTACDVDVLNVTVIPIEGGNKLEWEPYRKIDDQRKLLAYLVYLIKAPYKNITMYDGRDACGGDGWRVNDVAMHDNNRTIQHPLTGLEPYTQYGFYVKTYTVARERKGAQSPIQYFKTPPATPSLPTKLKVDSNASDSMILSWAPPKFPNGNVTYYIVSGRIQAIAPTDYANTIDYCNAPVYLINSPPSQPLAPATTTTTTTTSNDTCTCEKINVSETVINQSEEEARIKFEDELQNAVYIKKQSSSSSRRKRDAGVPQIANVTLNGTNVWDSFSFIVYGKTEFYVTNLRHYTTYDIMVQACREPEGRERVGNCSDTSSTSKRTLYKEGADDIHQVQITNQTLNSVSITWKEPDAPNGFIQSYSIEYRKLENENVKPSVECLLHTQFINQSRIYVLRDLPSGNYSLRVAASSSHATGAYSPVVYFFIEKPSADAATIALIVCAIFLAMIAAFVWYYRKRRTNKDNMRLIPSVNPEYVPSVYVPDEWEIPRKNIDLVGELGQGSFGMVYEGVVRDIRGISQMKCAVKTVNEHATNRERLEFLNEASVMKAFDTAHVVRLLGVVSQGQPTLVIMELMTKGDLKTYLRSHRPDANSEGFRTTAHSSRQEADSPQPPTLEQIFQMAIEIADGMAYLSAKKFVHRDLAARNCMVAEDLTVKIGDFGMTRDIYETDYYRKGTKGLLPVRWMAPESLKDGVFTSSSDVWSYGVVLWEMATLASQPYQGLSNDQVLRYVIEAGVMQMPENCPKKLYELMGRCWQFKPSARPSFLRLCSDLLHYANSSFANVSFYHSPAGIEARAAKPTTPSPSQDDPSTPLHIADAEIPLTTEDDESDEDEDPFLNDSDTHTFHRSFSNNKEAIMTTANGYVSGCPTNGAANTTQC